jgi:ATP-binding cassette subfamily B multidrug efflux pump
MSDTPPDYAQSDQAPQQVYDARLMRRALGYLRPYRWQVLLGVLLLVTASLAGLAGPWLVKLGIDQGIEGGDHRRLLELSLLFALLQLVEFGLGYWQTLIVAALGQRFMLDLRVQLFAHIQRLPVAFFDRNPVGRLMTRLTGDVELLNEMFSSGLVAMVGDLLTLAVILGYLLLLNVRLALITFALLPLLMLITLYFRGRLRRNFRDVQQRVAAMNAFLQEHLAGIEVLQVYGQETRAAARFSELNRSHTRAHLDSVFNFGLFYPLVEIVAVLSITLSLGFGGLWYAAGTGLSLGDLAAFILYARRFFQPISDLSEKFNIMQSAMASSERIFRRLDTPAEPPVPPSPAAPARLAGEIRFEGVRFGYDPERPVLTDIGFRIAPGERIALVGPTGGGKTSLLGLLLRFYRPQAGRILIDGIPLDALPDTLLRTQVALVQQEIVLFPGSIAENISLGNPAIGPERVREAARLVGALSFIERLPQGLDTPLLVGGGGLSTGQKQLIAFARALAPDPALLILDEATSAVDTETEALLQRGLEQLLTGRTSVVVAHRLSTIRGADRILVVQRGRIVETGDHAGLLAAGGLYARLHRLQYLGVGQN